MEYIVSKYNYWIYIFLMMIGFYAMMGKRNLIKKLIGMNIFQTAIILFFISTGVKKGGTVPIVMHHGHEAAQAIHHVIVVMVSTTGVALAVVKMLYDRYRTLEEDEILEMRK